jgi:hypothetical protein
MGSNPGKDKSLFSSPKRPDPSSGPPSLISYRYRGKIGRSVILTIQFYLAPRLRMSGAIPLFPLYAFMVWKVITSPFYVPGTISIWHSVDRISKLLSIVLFFLSHSDKRTDNRGIGISVAKFHFLHSNIHRYACATFRQQQRTGTLSCVSTHRTNWRNGTQEREVCEGREGKRGIIKPTINTAVETAQFTNTRLTLKTVHGAESSDAITNFQCLYKVVQIWPGLFVCKQVTVCPGHIWTTLY